MIKEISWESTRMIQSKPNRISGELDEEYERRKSYGHSEDFWPDQLDEYEFYLIKEWTLGVK